ncbi:MAG: hypothetical protein IPL46_03750 [Saprospiraceae bacterium]|nr:hypothetical protein [Saprospiraceae bacterium]
MIQLGGPGYVWFDFLMTVPSEDGVEKLIAKYARVDAYFGNHERGIAVFNDEKQVFERYREVSPWLEQPHTTEHPVKVSIDDQTYYYQTSEFNFSRVKPHLDSISQQGGYEYFTCLQPGEMPNSKKPRMDRDAAGRLVYRWKKNAATVNFQQQTALIEQGIISKEEALIQTMDLLTGEPVDAGRGSITWNPYRQRWIVIAGKQDIWYGEADTPTGPWVYVTKVATHDQYYYNPVHHSFLDQADGQRIYFEGTFTKFFSKEPPIPRYDYNQLLYAVDLANPNLVLPVPVYQLKSGDHEVLDLRPQIIDNAAAIQEIPFFALDRNNGSESVILIFQTTDGSGRLLKSNDGNSQPLFYALKPDLSIEKFFEGTWEFSIASRSFDNSVTLQIKQEGDQWQVSASKSGYQFTNLQITQDSIQLDLSHEGSDYHLTGTLLPGRISGSFLNLVTKSSGNWSANKHDQSWWAPLSPSLVDLYEIINSDGSYSYSLLSRADSQKMEQSTIFCKVWINPTSQINFDYEAQAAH